jgi:MoaA/NifB/PqqE/SkfB family radical SAM enzyme
MKKQAYLQILDRCNQKCVFCKSPSGGAADISFEEAKKRILQLAKEKVSVLHITGGEPTLHLKLVQIVRFAKESGIKKIEIQSNGQNFSDKNYVLRLIKAGLSAAHVALHDYSEKNSNKTRGVNSGFRRTLKGIKVCLKLGLPVKIIHVIYSGNYKNLPRFVDFLRKNFSGISYLNLSLAAPEGRALDLKWPVPDYVKLKPYLKKAIEKAEKWGVSFDVSEIVPLCVVEGHENRAVSTRFMLDKLAITDDFYKNKKRHGIKFSGMPQKKDQKSVQCAKCSLDKICAGFHPDYTRIRGFSAFVPSKKSLKKVLEKFSNYKK